MGPDQQPPKDSSQIITSPSPALSQSSTVFDKASPRTPIRHRATFARLTSADDGRYEAIKDEDDITEANPYNDSNPAHGLGISFSDDQSKQHRRLTSDDMKSGYTVETHELSPWATHQNAKQSVTSFQSSTRQNTAYTPDVERLRNRRSFADSLRMAYDDFVPGETCAAHTNFYHGRSYWLSVAIMILAVYSTIFSAIFLILGLRGPRYRWVRETGGTLTPDQANLMTAFFAKTIELSFATVFVSFLGQVLSRRAFMKNQGRGVTLAEFDMRSWVMQPGTLITHWAAAKTSLFSFLGGLSLIAAIVAMLYTTASEALVQPQLRFGPWKDTSLQGLVKASFANGDYLEENCPTPILTDATYGGTTCLQIQYAAQGYHNYQRYISDWAAVANNGNGSSDLARRPKGFALLYENTTVKAPWVDIYDIGYNYRKHKRVINNVTLAMPHAGVPAAARDAVNGILQPEDLNGQGIYNLRASVPSPAVNVMCVNMDETELAPIVYEAWHPGVSVNATAWANSEYASLGPLDYSNTTVVDDIFGWGEKYSTVPPVLPRYPLEYNTLLNHSKNWGPDAIYLLGKGIGPDYALCSIKVFQTPFCSTSYNASSSGAQLEAVCSEDDNSTATDRMAYIHSLTNATTGSANLNKDWVMMASEWANSLSLNAGISDGDASNARLMTQFMVPSPTDPTAEPALSAGLPSMAEALAVLAGCTLLMSSSSAPYVQFWNYSNTALKTGQYQYFNASLRAQEYSSGGNGDAAMRGFYIVLFAVMIINLICLGYFVLTKGLVTDFSEPLNLFSLAVNSPPSDVMAGSCAAGPRGRQYRVGWFVNAAGDHLYMENKVDQGDGVVSPPPPPPPGQTSSGQGGMVDPAKTPLRRAVDKLSHRTSWL